MMLIQPEFMGIAYGNAIGGQGICIVIIFFFDGHIVFDLTEQKGNVMFLRKTTGVSQ